MGRWQSLMRTHTIWTDGSCLGNPGYGGWAAIVFKSAFGLDYPQPMERIYGSDLLVTNNRMELQAIISGLNHLPERSNIRVVTDSSYCADGATKWHKKWIERGWKGVANVDMWHSMLDAIERHKRVEFKIVKGHSKIHWNEECDTIAKTVAKWRREFEETGNNARIERLQRRIESGGLFDKDLAR